MLLISETEACLQRAPVILSLATFSSVATGLSRRRRHGPRSRLHGRPGPPGRTLSHLPPKLQSQTTGWKKYHSLPQRLSNFSRIFQTALFILLATGMTIP
jgi:hypothetical protein